MSNDFKFKKKYGQNFLRDKNIIYKIVSSVGMKENSLVLEVGPGMGILTCCLAEHADKVICYEVDLELKKYLESNLKKYDNVIIHFQDFLEANIEEELKNFSYDSLYFISNVPYYITTPILMKLIHLPLVFSNIVMMVQKEVADRFSSLPGSREYGSITVYLNYFYEVSKLFDVRRENFTPSPNVDSSVISLCPRNRKFDAKDLNLFLNLVRDSFQFKRKTLRNNLKKYDLEKILMVLQKYGYDLNIRAENLAVEVFIEISNALSN